VKARIADPSINFAVRMPERFMIKGLREPERLAVDRFTIDVGEPTPLES